MTRPASKKNEKLGHPFPFLCSKKGLWITPQPVFAVLILHLRFLAGVQVFYAGLLAQTSSHTFPSRVSSVDTKMRSFLTVAGPRRTLTCFPLSHPGDYR